MGTDAAILLLLAELQAEILRLRARVTELDEARLEGGGHVPERSVRSD